MGSPVGPILANVFVVEFGKMQVPRLHQHIKKWRYYVDDTFAYVKNEFIDNVLTILNSFHTNINFIYGKKIAASYRLKISFSLEMEHI